MQNSMPSRAQTTTASAASSTACSIDGKFLRRELAQHVVGPVPTFRRGADADAKPRKLLRSQPPNDVVQPLLPARRPSRPKPQLAHRQVQVVAEDQQVLVRQLVKTHRLLNAGSAEVHEGRRAQQQGLLAAQVGLDHLAVKPRLGRGRAEPSGQLGQDGIADVVPRPLVTAARIAQPNHEFHRRRPRNALLTSSHRRRGSTSPPTPLPPSPWRQ